MFGIKKFWMRRFEPIPAVINGAFGQQSTVGTLLPYGDVVLPDDDDEALQYENFSGEVVDFEPAFDERSINENDTAEMKQIKTSKKFPTKSVWPNRFLRTKHLPNKAKVFKRVTKYKADEKWPMYATLSDRRQIIDHHVTLVPDKVTKSDAVVVKYFPGVFTDLLTVINEATEIFLRAAQILPKTDTTREGITEATYHFGRWERRGNPEAPSSIMKHEFAADLVKALAEVSRRVDRYFQLNFPELWPFLKRVTERDLPGDITRVYRMFALNDSLSDWHVDYGDFVDGFCAIIPFGNYEGGDLLLPDINYRIPAKPGDLIFFRSQFMLHKNAPVTRGHRRSLVYYTHQIAVSRYLMSVMPNLTKTRHALDFCRNYWSYKDDPIEKIVDFKRRV